MRVPFRQGLLSFQKIGSTPTFLQQSSTDSAFVSHVVEPTPTVVTFAHGTSDYLQVFDAGVDLAWGPVTGVTTYLFWDMDRFTGVITRGITILEPVVSSLTPQNPVNGQNWFDLNTNKMKMWKSSTSAWVEVIRVFAGRITGSTITPNAEGSQVGLNTPATAGYVMLDTLLNPLRKSNGEFLTDSEPSYVRTTSSTSGVLVQPISKVITVKAAEAIPRMSLVYFSAADTIRLASSNPALMPSRVPVGMVMDQLNIGDQGTVVIGGEVSYDQWDWSAAPGAALYATTSGQVTTTRPAGLMAYRVGFVKNANTIIFNVDAETTPQVYTANENAVIITGIEPVVITDELNGLGERVVTIEVDEATGTTAGLMSASNFTLLGSVDTRLTDAESDVADLELSKADTIHVHTISDVTGLQTALDTKAATVHTHVAADVTDLQPLLDAKAATVHAHVIPDVTGLQTALNQKAFADHLNEFDEIFQTVTRTPGSADVGSGATLASALAAKADVTHIHAITDVTNLQAELSNRAFASHTHTIGNVTGLQTSLDAKAAIIHTHVIGDVVGLSDALAIKSNVGHTHVIADVTALQAALDTLQTNINGKANISHTHVITDVTGLQAELDGKALLVHTHIIPDVLGLEDELDAKAAAVHTHVAADVTDLQALLDAKAEVVHTHIVDDVLGLQAELDGKSPVGHNHVIADVTGLADAFTDLQADVDAKAPIIHTHVASEVTDLQPLLDAKADTAHTHTAANITDFSEAVDDRVAALIVPGSNITAVYNDGAGTLTLSATAGGGGSELQTSFTTQELDTSVLQLFNFDTTDPVSGFPADPWGNTVPGGDAIVEALTGYSFVTTLGSSEFGTVLRLNGTATPDPINFPIPATSQEWAAEFFLARGSSATWTPGHSRVLTVNAGTAQQITVDILENGVSSYIARFTFGATVVDMTTLYDVSVHFMIEISTLSEAIRVFSNGEPVNTLPLSALGLSAADPVAWVVQIGVAGVTVQPLPIVSIDNYRLIAGNRLGGFSLYTPELSTLLYVPMLNTAIVTSAITFADNFSAQILAGAGTSGSPASIEISGPSALIDLTDVVVNTTFVGQGAVMLYDGVNWSNGVLDLTDLADVNLDGYAPNVGDVLTYVGGGGSGDWIAAPPEVNPPYVRSFGEIVLGTDPAASVVIPTFEAGAFTGTASPFPAQNAVIYPDQTGTAPDLASFIQWTYVPRDADALPDPISGSSSLTIFENGYFQLNLKGLIRFNNSEPAVNTGAVHIVAKNSYGRVIGTVIVNDPYTTAEKTLLFTTGITFDYYLNVSWNFWVDGDALSTGYDTITIEVRNVVTPSTGTVTVEIIGAEVGMVVLALDGAPTI